MTDEMRAAAERVVEWYDRDGSVGGAVEPIEELRALIAEHPADDDDPVTYDWICGLLPICRKFSGLMLTENLRVLNSSKGWGVYFAHEDLEGFELVCRVSTRRHVRDLIRALKGGE